MQISAPHPSFTFLGRSLFPNSDLMKWIRWLWRSRWIFLSKPLKWDSARMRISFGCVSAHVFMSCRSVCAQWEKRSASYTGMIWCHIDSRLIGLVKLKRKPLHSDGSITGQSDLTDNKALSVLIMAVQLLPSFLSHLCPYLHISARVQAVIKIEPGGFGVIWLACNPQVKVSNPCIQLLGDVLILQSSKSSQQEQQF